MNAPQIPSISPARARSSIYPFYVVSVLLIAYILSFMDRTVLSLLIDPIRTDLRLSDTAIGVLVGFGFVLIYSTAGLALGRIADSGNRRRLIAIGMLVWSIATAMSAFATGFASLLLVRLMVGVGEATLSPASYSLIASYFSRERLGLATSIYALGTVLGSGVASALIGAVAHMAGSSPAFSQVLSGTSGWRTVFMIVGLLGLPFVLLMLTIREPRQLAAANGDGVPSLRSALQYFHLHSRAYGGIIGGYSIMTMTSFTAVLWGPTYFIRLHGFNPAGIGSLFGIIMGVGGTAGVLTGGVLTDRLTRCGFIDAAPRVVVGSLLVQTALFPAAYLLSDTHAAIGFFACAIFVMAFQGGLQGASIQLLAPERMRGFAMAVYLLSANIVGMGCGPLIVGLLTDRVFHRPDAVGKSLAGVAVGSSVVAAWVLIRALPSFRGLVRTRSSPDHGTPTRNSAKFNESISP